MAIPRSLIRYTPILCPKDVFSSPPPPKKTGLSGVFNMNGGRNYQHLPWWGWAWQDCSSSSFQVFQGPLCGLPSGASEWLLRALRVMVGDGLALVTAIPGSYSNPQEPNLLRSNSPTRFCNQKDAEKEHLSNYYFRAGLYFNLHLNLRGCYKSIECHHYWISFKKHLQETSIFDGEKKHGFL